MPRSKTLNAEMRAESRTKILESAGRLFAQNGYYSCKMVDIAKAAEMSVGNVYWYYPGKEDVLRAVMEAGFETQEAVLREAASYSGRSQDRLRFLIDHYIDFCREHYGFMKVLLSLQGHGGTEFFSKLGFDLTDIAARHHGYLQSLFMLGQIDGTIAAGDPTVLAMSFFSFFNGMLVTYSDAFMNLDKAPIRESVMRLLTKK